MSVRASDAATEGEIANRQCVDKHSWALAVRTRKEHWRKGGAASSWPMAEGNPVRTKKTPKLALHQQSIGTPTLVCVHGAHKGQFPHNIDKSSPNLYSNHPQTSLQGIGAYWSPAGAIEDGKLTKLGEKMALLPLDPNLSKVLFDAISKDVSEEAAAAVAISTLAGRVFLRLFDSVHNYSDNSPSLYSPVSLTLVLTHYTTLRYHSKVVLFLLLILCTATANNINNMNLRVWNIPLLIIKNLTGGQGRGVEVPYHIINLVVKGTLALKPCCHWSDRSDWSFETRYLAETGMYALNFKSSESIHPVQITSTLLSSREVCLVVWKLQLSSTGEGGGGMWRIWICNYTCSLVLLCSCATSTVFSRRMIGARDDLLALGGMQ